MHQQHSINRSVIVIGAGIAGASTAYILAKSGWTVTVLDVSPQAASGASGNEIGILYPRFEALFNEVSRFYLNCVQACQQMLYSLETEGHAGLWQQCGVLKLATCDEDFARFNKIVDVLRGKHVARLLRPDEVNEAAGLEIRSSGGLLLPELGYARPKALCQALLEHPAISQVFSCQAMRVTARDSGWAVECLIDNHMSWLEADKVVIANGIGALQFQQLQEMAISLQPVRGQLTMAPNIRNSGALRTVLCGKYGYMTPQVKGWHCLGATYDYHTLDLKLRPDDHRQNLQVWSHYLAKDPPPDIQLVEGRAAIRAVSKNRMPVFGAVSGYAGLYASIAHGSRGLLTAPMAAVHIANDMAQNL